MAKEKKGKVSKLTSLFGKLEERGIEVSIQKTKLWSEPEIIEEDLDEFDLYISQEYENSAYAVVKDGTKSKAISFAADELDVTEYDVTNEKGLVAADDVDFSINIGLVTALRDDEELGISKGDIKAKAYMA